MSEGSAEHDGIRIEEIVGLLRRRSRTVALTAAIVFMAMFAWVETRIPVYRASATVLIDRDQGQSGLLSELASIGSAPAAASEIAILTSRSIAEQVVRGAGEDEVGHPGVPGFDRHLGLATTVEDQQLRPLSTLWARLFGDSSSSGRLHAHVDEAGPGAPSSVLVGFPAPNRVRLSEPGFLEPLGIGAASELFELEPDQPLEYRGLVLRLHVEGDVSGREFLIQHVSPDTAVRRLVSNTRVIETERDSGVVLVTVSDSDPVRAARTADALCLNYFDLSIERGSKRASQTVTFIETQLEAQIAELAAAESAVVDLRADHPETIDISASAQVLIQRLSDFEVERVHLQLAYASLEEAIGLLEENELDALSRLGNEVADPISRAYIEQISTLTSEFELQAMSDGGPYKLLLQTKLEKLSSDADDLASEAMALRAVIESYEAGDDAALAGLTGREDDGFGVGPLVAGYLSRVSDLRAEQAELSQVYTEEFPRIAELRSVISDLEARVLEQLKGRLEALQKLRADRARLIAKTRTILDEYPGEEREKIRIALENIRARTIEHLRARFGGVGTKKRTLQEQIAQIEERLGELPEKERRLAGPLRRLETHSEIVKFLLKSKQDAEIARAATVATADFIDPSTPPILRYAPRVGFTLAMSVLMGFALGMGVAYLRERFKGSVHTEAELEAVSGLPVLGAIPDFKSGRFKSQGAGPGFLAVRDDPESPVAEAYRSLRANLRFALGGDREIRTLAVTSCAPGEGKSTTNADLAIAFANGNKRVLLVDVDMRKPTVHRNFGVDREPGLADILVDDVDWRQCVCPTTVPDLDVLPAGFHRGKPGDLLARPEIGTLVDTLADNYDVVVFDLPPALVVADVEIFAHKLDAMLLLYRADGAAREAIQSAASRLRQTGSNLVGCVLNAVRPSHGRSSAYYSYYDYGSSDSRYRKGA